MDWRNIPLVLFNVTPTDQSDIDASDSANATIPKFQTVLLLYLQYLYFAPPSPLPPYHFGALLIA